ncbi:hypothetical protein RRG08_029469 [Elysia crispata]|uniref:Uncharacterized protein n=1 Tax=Elysia crispata TaxID=231223 RepID=A0AAE1BEY9_9GAST|nr:hypothetical protein RRG08_029469 [Elysia crispata]
MDVSRHENLNDDDTDRIKDNAHEQPLGTAALTNADESNNSPAVYQTGQPQQSSRERAGRKRKRDYEHRHADDEQPMVEYNGLTTNIPKSDKFDTFGHYVSHSLRQMSAEQYIHTQKLIADALYEGQLGNLSRRSRLLADPE